MKFLFLSLAFIFGFSSCKSRFNQDSAIKDIGYFRSGSELFYSEVFSMEGDDVVLRACIYTNMRNNRPDHKLACRYNESRIPFKSLKSDIEQYAKMAQAENVQDYISHVDATIRRLRVVSDSRKAAILQFDEESKSVTDASLRSEIELQKELLASELQHTQLEIDYYEVAKSLAIDITSSRIVNEQSVVDKILEDLNKNQIVSSNRDGRVLFPVSFSYQVWEGPEAGRARNMRASLNSAYTMADSAERQQIVLALVAGPALRNAWAKVYNASLKGQQSAFNTALNRMRKDQSRRIVTKNSTLVFAGEFIEHTETQSVRRFVAEGSSWKGDGLVTQIRDLSCSDIFGSSARIAIKDELVNAGSSIYEWEHFSKISKASFWAPLKTTGSKFGSGLQGWTSWLKDKMRSDDRADQVMFSAGGRVTTVSGDTPPRSQMFCVLN